MDKSDIFIRIIVVLGLFAIGVTIVWAVIAYEPGSVIVYLLPDGVICEQSWITGNMGKATHEFSRCSDGFTHINPEKYRRVRK